MFSSQSMIRLVAAIILSVSFSVNTLASDDVSVLNAQQAEAASQGGGAISQGLQAYMADLAIKTDKTRWNGEAVGTAHKKVASGVGPLVGGPYTPEKADMSFQTAVEGGESHIYYLSAISQRYDKQIEEDAKGLCVNARPREVTLRWNAQTGAYQPYVQLTKFVGAAESMTPTQIARMSAADKKKLIYTLYKVPLKDIDLGNSTFSFYSFLPVPRALNIPNPDNYVMKIKYDLNKQSSQRNRRLASRLSQCLSQKPWEAFTYMTESQLAALQSGN